MSAILRKLRWLLTRRQREADLAEELRFHLSEEADEHGSDAALRQLGNVGLIKEDTRAMWGWTSIEPLIQDLQYAARTLRKNLAFTALAAASLALGIGANTAIFSFMNGVMMRWLPVRDPESLALLQWHMTGRRNTDDSTIQSESGHFDD